MQPRKSAGRLIFATLLLVVLATTPAHAYIDPGSGSIVIQGMIAATLALLFALKNYWRRLTSWIAAKFGRASQGDAS